MTTLKFTGKPTASAMAALEPHIGRLYNTPGASCMAIIEMRHVERLQPAPGSDKAASVGMKLVGCEIPTREQEGVVREAQRALYLQRTARGTLDEDGQLTLDASTLALVPGLLNSLECARLRAGLDHWVGYVRKVVAGSHKMSAMEVAHELEAVADGMAAVLANAAVEEE